MKKRIIGRWATFALLIASIMLVSSCEKTRLNWPPWRSPGKKTISETAGFDWPRWRGPDGNGISKETEWNPESLRNGPKIVWRANVGKGYSNVSIKNYRLYTMGVKERLTAVYCLNAETGKEIWRRTTENFQDPQSTPTIDGEFVYALSKEGLLLCLKAKNGKIQWKRNIVEEFRVQAPYYGFAGSPVIQDELITLTVNTAGMALNKKTGEKVWGSEKPPKKRYHYSGTSAGTEYSTPVIYSQGGKPYTIIASYEGLHSVDVQTGKLLWLFDWQEAYETGIGCQVTDPIVFDNKLFIVQYYNYHFGSALFDIGGNSPKVLWTNNNMKSQTSSPVMVDGFFYACQGGVESSSGSLRCLDVETGKMMWEEKLEGRPVSLTAADGKLIILDYKGALFITEATSSGYREISRCLIPDQKAYERWWTYPVLCNGKIYCRSYDGDLVCMDVSK